MELHDVYVDASRQSLWEDRLRLHFSIALRSGSAYISRICNARKKRRAKATQAWMGVLKKFLQGMVAGHCDLDILLDPFFQPVTPTRQLSYWTPRVNQESSQPGLMEALQVVDDVEPWRIFYHKNIHEHPAFGVSRLHGKLSPPDTA
ncbi:unnamed protein product [Peronospora effusa]|nr:unnamed protein product [Peronospora effusa]